MKNKEKLVTVLPPAVEIFACFYWEGKDGKERGVEAVPIIALSVFEVEDEDMPNPYVDYRPVVFYKDGSFDDKPEECCNFLGFALAKYQDICYWTEEIKHAKAKELRGGKKP